MKNHLLKMDHPHSKLIMLWVKGEEILEWNPCPHGGGYWKLTAKPDWNPNKKFIPATTYYK